MAGNNSVRGLETITFTDNMSFDGTERGGAMIADAQVWLGSGTLPSVRLSSFTSSDGSILFSFSKPTATTGLLNMRAVGGGGPGTPTDIGVDVNTGGSNPVLPDGSNVITITGGQVSAGTVGANVIRTDSTVLHGLTIEIQRTAAVGVSASLNNGVSHFDSAAFDVDANGFVQLNGGGIAATSFEVEQNTAPGTDPVVPTASGVVTVNGAVVANHSVVLESRSRAANAYNLEVQYAAAAAATDGTKSGVAHFDSDKFTVDASGFVSASGTGIGQTITGDAGGALSPTAGNWNILGGSVVAGTSPIATSGAVSTLTINAQRSQAIAAADSTKVGLSNFDSAAFGVDVDGFVTLKAGGAAIEQIDVDSGVNVVPSAGIVSIKASAVAQQAIPIQTKNNGVNAVLIESQLATTAAADPGDKTLTGLSCFDSAKFTISVNGFVSVSGTGIGQTITGQSGGALSPTAGNWNISGASTAAGTSPVVTSGAASTLTVNVQKSQAIAAADATKVGLAAFDSTDFAVDANGFVTLGATGAGQTITGNSGGALSPTAGNWNIVGGSVVAGTNPISTSGAASTLTINAQRSQAIAAADSTKVGLSNFDSAAFDVDTDGFVQLKGGGIAATAFDVQTNTAPGTDPVVPTAVGVVTVKGAVVANHSVVLESRSRAANEYNLEVQYATSAAATDGTKSGVAHFDSADFAVDASGFVSLSGGGGGGGFFLIQTLTANNDSFLEFTNVFSGTYQNYLIIGRNLQHSVGGANLSAEFGTGVGPTWQQTNYNNTPAGGTTRINIDGSTPQSNTSNGQSGFTMTVLNTQEALRYKSTIQDAVTTIGNVGRTSAASRWADATLAVNSIRFFWTFGVIVAGQISVYGYDF